MQDSAQSRSFAPWCRRARPGAVERRVDRYNAIMNLSLSPASSASFAVVDSSAADFPTGLTGADADRIRTAITAARAASTRKVYAQAWSHWERWCAERSLTALPGNPYALAAYLTERAEDGRAMATLDMARTVIRHVHRVATAEDPVASEVVDQVRRGLRRTYGVTPRRRARPLTIEELRRILAAIDRTSVIGIRDAAMILLGFASALRRAELVPLTLDDIAYQPTGLLLNIRQSKMDQEGHGALVAVARGQQADTDPVAALAAWRALRGEQPGMLFTRLWGNTISEQPLAGRAVLRVLRGRAQAAGIDATRLTAHSLRAGHATTAALAGVPLDRIAAQTRHKDLNVLVTRYIRPVEALATTSSTHLGL